MQNTVTAQITSLATRQNSSNAPLVSCRYGGGRFELSETGVYFLGKDKDNNEQPPQWVCAPLNVIAKTRDEKSGEWGRLLEWKDDDGYTHQWAMPLELLESDGVDVRRELARLGLQISPSHSARGLLVTYIKIWSVEARARCVDRLGWYGNIFVTPPVRLGKLKKLSCFKIRMPPSPLIVSQVRQTNGVILWLQCRRAIRGLYSRFCGFCRPFG